MEMTKKERILAWVKDHQEPNQDICPELVQYWKNSKGKYVEWSSKTGKRTETGLYESGYRYTSWKCGHKSVNSYGYIGAYIDTDGKDMLELGWISIDGKRGKDGEKREWRYQGRTGARFFIFAHDPHMYRENGEPYAYDQKTYVNSKVARWFNDMDGEVWGRENTNILDRFLEENYGANMDGENLWRYGEFYKKQWIQRKRSKRVQDIESYELEPMDNDSVQFDVLDNSYAVIRLKYSNGGEYFRMFISDKGKVTMMTNEEGKWRLTPSREYWSVDSNKNLTPGMFEAWKPLKWISPCINWNVETYRNNNVASVLRQIACLFRHPIVESLIKSGYPAIAKRVAKNKNIAKNIEYMFGAKEKKGSIYQVLGVNKHILQLLESEFEKADRDNRPYWHIGGFSSNVISIMKEVMDAADLSSLSKETVNAVLPGVCKLSMRSRWRNELFGRQDRWGGYGYHFDRELTSEERASALKLCKREAKQPSFIEMFFDTKQMMDRLVEAPDIDLLTIDSISELRRLHDAFIEMQQQEKLHMDELRQKKFEKLNAKRIEKFEREDDEFMIRVPRALNEIVSEGNTLHHCVGGYTNRVADGGTNILFLRRKSAPGVPFYTIEITPEMRLQQIHGACNKWLGNDPDAIPFVYEWLTSIGVNFDRQILLNLGQGYGRSQSQLNESYLYRKESEVA